MEWLPVSLALGLPWMVVAPWLRSCWRHAPAGIWPLALGYGYLLGLLLVAILLHVQVVLGIGLDFIFPMTVLSVLAMAGGGFAWWRLRGGTTTATTGSHLSIGAGWREMLVWQRLIFVLLLAWLAWRITGLAQEVWLRPLYPWDAWTTWIARARVWSSLGEWVPFVDATQWLNDSTASVYTLPAWHYPDAVSLIAVWPTLALGKWNETAANLPWLGAFVALGLGFYGQIRLWGASSLAALVFTWMLLSLPMLNAHVALAGYADLWLTAVFGLAGCAFLQWARTGQRWQGLLALLLVLACPWIKREGLVWAALFVPAAVIVWIPRRYWCRLIISVMAVVFVWYMAGGFALTAPGLGEFRLTPEQVQLPWLGTFDLHYHDVWNPLLRNLLMLGNWHLFMYLFLISMLLALPQVLTEVWRLAGAVLVGSSLVVLYILFFYTEAYLWVEQYTSVNRLIMHFVPAWLFWSMTIFLPLFADRLISESVVER